MIGLTSSEVPNTSELEKLLALSQGEIMFFILLPLAAALVFGCTTIIHALKGEVKSTSIRAMVTVALLAFGGQMLYEYGQGDIARPENKLTEHYLYQVIAQGKDQQNNAYAILKTPDNKIVAVQFDYEAPPMFMWEKEKASKWDFFRDVKMVCKPFSAIKENP